MAVVETLIRKEDDGTLSFGNYTLGQKSKLSDFEHEGDLYKVKTFNEITKLEKNGLFVYESVPGTTVENLKITADRISFIAYGDKDAQITMELEPSKEYAILIDNTDIGEMRTNLGGKLSFSVELQEGRGVQVEINRLDK